MATPAQILANRANAQKSTGPRSAEGKAASCFNALKHGLDAQSVVLPGEDPAEYEALAREYDRSLRPDTPAERFHVDTLIRADWQKRRLQLVEADRFRTVLAENPGASLAAALLSESPAAKLLARVQRQLSAFERAWFRAHREFRRGREHSADNEMALIEALSPARPCPRRSRRFDRNWLRSRKATNYRPWFVPQMETSSPMARNMAAFTASAWLAASASGAYATCT
jgi:hypothetical protein